MKTKWITTMVSILGINLAHGVSYVAPDWVGDAGTVHAEWNDSWAGFAVGNHVSAATEFTVVSLDGNPLGAVPGSDTPDASHLGNTHFHADAGGNYLEVTANWDLSFWVPSFAGQEAQEGFIEISYYDDPGTASWRQGWDLVVTPAESASMLRGAPVLLGETHDTATGIITEAYSFALARSTSGFFIDVAADPALSLINPAYLVDFSVDTASYNVIPEPGAALLALLLGAGVAGPWRRRPGKKTPASNLRKGGLQ